MLRRFSQRAKVEAPKSAAQSDLTKARRSQVQCPGGARSIQMHERSKWWGERQVREKTEAQCKMPVWIR